jgi:DNA-binding MarR family transcriptional regulator
MTSFQRLGEVHRVEQLVNELWVAKAQALGVKETTLRQALVMAIIGEGQRKAMPCSQTDVVEASGIDRTTVASIMRRLAQRKLIARRRRRFDQRAYDLTITGQGADEMRLLRRIADETYADVRERVIGLEGLAVIRKPAPNDAASLTDQPPLRVTTPVKPAPEGV